MMQRDIDLAEKAKLQVLPQEDLQAIVYRQEIRERHNRDLIANLMTQRRLLWIGLALAVSLAFMFLGGLIYLAGIHAAQNIR